MQPLGNCLANVSEVIIFSGINSDGLDGSSDYRFFRTATVILLSGKNQRYVSFVLSI